MNDSPDRLNATHLRAALARHPFVSDVLFYGRLDSTNDVARQRADEGAAEGLLVVADRQMAGRGRMGRKWWAPKGSALLTSLLFRPVLASDKAPQLTMLCALAAADAVGETTGLAADLKWPNDLLIGDHKVAGLLTETAFTADRLDFVVVGLGVNVNTDFEDAPPFMAPASSLRLLRGQPVDRLALLVAYLDQVARRYAQLQAGVTPHDEWASRLVTLGQSVTARLSDGRTLVGLARRVSADGALLLQTPDGAIHRLYAADVSLRGS